MTFSCRLGVDENGLGARLGPLVVTGVLARVSDSGHRWLARRRLPARLAADLDDSKRLVSHGNVLLGEAWARAVAGPAESPAELVDRLSVEGTAELRRPCPRHVEGQCWSTGQEAFVADEETLDRLRGHLARMRDRGVEVLGARSSIVCTKLLNDRRASGHNRFVVDLHAMERLVLALRHHAKTDVLAVCGKVGGIDDYSRYFGPLSHRLHAVVKRGKEQSIYHFPGLGELRFVRDADARDPLVMLASVVGKYIRELMMSRISNYYARLDDTITPVSGYHDPATARFVQRTARLRRLRRVTHECFERARTSTDDHG